MRFLNLMPSEFEVGDVWNEGQEVSEIVRIPWLYAYRISFSNGMVEQEWPALAPRRIGRRTADA